MSGQFTADMEAWVEKTQLRADQVVRAVALEVLSRVILRSPVGNPELWAANQVAVEGRKAAVAAAQASGKRISRKRVEREHPLVSGKGYVGGRFRGAWSVTFSEPSTYVPDDGVVDPSGAGAITAGSDVLKDTKVGVSIFLVNNLPYAERIEFGWSHQAASGVVRVTVSDFTGIVDDVAGADAEEGGE